LIAQLQLDLKQLGPARFLQLLDCFNPFNASFDILEPHLISDLQIVPIPGLHISLKPSSETRMGESFPIIFEHPSSDALVSAPLLSDRSETRRADHSSGLVCSAREGIACS